MEKIEAIYNLVDNNRSKEEIEEWEKALDSLSEKIGLNLYNDEILIPLVQYISDIEKKNFIEGFKYAIQLVKECWIWTT